jgi:DNA-binding MarR family transcriptional regulator
MTGRRSTAERRAAAFGQSGPPLGFLLASVGFSTGFRFRELLAPAGLGPREFAVLRQVAGDEGVSQHGCGMALKVAPSRMVVLIDELEAKGLLERRPNPTDRRARALYLTQSGRDALAQAYQAAARNEAEVFGSFSADEREELRRLLQVVAGKLGLEPGVHPGMGQD